MLSLIPLATLLLAAPLPYAEEIDAALEDVQHIYPVPPTLVLAIMRQESNFNPKAYSRAGAIGLMQVMPATAKGLGIAPSELWQPSRNILAGVRLLAALLERYQGDLISVLIAYNAGPRKKGAPPPQNGETPGFVAAVLRNFHEYEAQAELEQREARAAELSGP